MKIGWNILNKDANHINLNESKGRYCYANLLNSVQLATTMTLHFRL